MKTIVLLTKLHGFLPSEIERMTLQDMRLALGVIEEYMKQEEEAYNRAQARANIH